MSDDRMRDKINIDEEKHELFKELCDDANPVFRTMKDVFLTAAALGFRAKCSAKLGKKRAIFAWAQFSAQEDLPLLKALAMAHTKDPAVLSDRERVLTILEEYANGGVGILQSSIMRGGEPLVNALTLLFQAAEEDAASTA